MKHSPKNVSRGSVLVEFTLAVPILTLLFLGTFQFGWAYFLYSELETCVRAGARDASTRTYRPLTKEAGADPSSDSTYLTAVRNTVLYGGAGVGLTLDKKVVPDLQASQVVVTMPEYNLKPTRVRVCINGYSVGFFSPVQMDNKPCVEFPYVGNFAPLN